jgi:hypothetical protein
MERFPRRLTSWLTADRSVGASMRRRAELEVTSQRAATTAGRAAALPPPPDGPFLVILYPTPLSRSQSARQQPSTGVIPREDGRPYLVAPESLVETRQTAPGPQIWAPDAVEVLSAPEHLARAAVNALGWEGVVLPPMVLLGRRVVVVASIISEVHAQRVSLGWRPVTDRTSVSTWNWPEMQHLVPPLAVQLNGVLAPARHWRTGLTGAAPFSELCPTALLLPSHIARNVECLSHAEYYGPAVLAAAGPHDVDPEAVDVVHTGRWNPVATKRPPETSRWVHELVYDSLLALHQ